MDILTRCPGCQRLLAPEPDGTVCCAWCARPGWVDRLEGFFRRHFLGSFLVAVAPLVGSALGIALWALLWSGAVGWGLKNASGSVLLGVAMEAGVAVVAAELLRRLLPFGRPNLQIAAWSAALVAIPGVLVALRILVLS